MPRQRTKDLIVRAHGEETLVLDRRTGTAHCLPAEVTRVWDACTGRNTLAEIASAAGINEPLAASAVEQLMERDLVEVPAGIDRRKLLRRAALVGTGVAAAPVIQSVVAPPAAWAATGSGVITNQVCNPPLRSLYLTLEVPGLATGPGYVGVITAGPTGTVSSQSDYFNVSGNPATGTTVFNNVSFPTTGAYTITIQLHANSATGPVAANAERVRTRMPDYRDLAANHKPGRHALRPGLLPQEQRLCSGENRADHGGQPARRQAECHLYTNGGPGSKPCRLPEQRLVRVGQPARLLPDLRHSGRAAVPGLPATQ